MENRVFLSFPKAELKRNEQDIFRNPEFHRGPNPSETLYPNFADSFAFNSKLDYIYIYTHNFDKRFPSI